MDTQTKTTQHSDSVKKPYQTPELVVLGEAAEVTQNTFDVNVDTAALSDTGS